VPEAPEALWPGPWRWSLYDADTPELALELAGRGAELVQTRAIRELLGDPRLGGRGRASA
jgi:glycerophosphoryl diester phosphodiesterase